MNKRPTNTEAHADGINECIGDIGLYLLETGTIEWFGPGDGNIYLTPDELERLGQKLIAFAQTARTAIGKPPRHA